MYNNRRLQIVAGCILILGVFMAWGLAIKAEVPRSISYQGCLTDSLGNPVPDGTYNLTFALYADSAGGVSLWSNVNAKSGQLVDVVNGIFTYRLGSASPLPPDLFNDSSLWLGITVVGGGAGELAPRTRLSSVPFAYRALYADNVPAGGGWSQGAGTVYLTNPSDKVGIGVSDPTENFVIGKNLGSFNGNRIIVGDTAAGAYTGLVAGEDNDNRGWLLWDNDGDYFCAGMIEAGTQYNNVLNIKTGRVGINNTAPGEPLSVGAHLGAYYGDFVTMGRTGSGRYSGFMCGEDSLNQGAMVWINNSNYLRLGTREGGADYGLTMVLKSGKVGIGTDSPSERLVVGKDMGSFAGEVIVIGNDDAGKYSAIKMGEDADNCCNLIWYNDDNYMTINTKEAGVVYDPVIIRGGKLSIGDEIPFAGITCRRSGTAILGEDTPGTYGGTGVLGKSSDEAGMGVSGMGMGTSGKGVIGQAYGSGGHGVHAEAKTNARVAIYAESDFANGVGIEAHVGSGGLAGKFYGNVGLYSPADNHMIMMLGEGLDYAEGFHASDPHKAEPGAVMSIDPIHPGKLAISNSPYDTKVAGIVAGANDLKSGVRLGTDGFDLDVALAGRVYCNVEATQHAIRPGDLLTTSSVPGYAMKATDYTRARGAILGKAMESLDKGEKGQILVLVTLQ